MTDTKTTGLELRTLVTVDGEPLIYRLNCLEVIQMFNREVSSICRMRFYYFL